MGFLFKLLFERRTTANSATFPFRFFFFSSGSRLLPPAQLPAQLVVRLGGWDAVARAFFSFSPAARYSDERFHESRFGGSSQHRRPETIFARLARNIERLRLCSECFIGFHRSNRVPDVGAVGPDTAFRRAPSREPRSRMLLRRGGFVQFL